MRMVEKVSMFSMESWNETVDGRKSDTASTSWMLLMLRDESFEIELSSESYKDK